MVGTIAALSLPTIVVGAVLFMLPVAWLAIPLPTLPADSFVYDQSGALVAVLYSTQNRMPIPYSDVPPVMQNALVAIEDNTFWVEPAIDPVGIARAALVNVAAGHIVEGGSTITQQLAKNLYLSGQRTVSRKLKELLITVKLSTMLSKQQILSMYLNDVYFGEGTYGIQAASERYFGHGARTLSLPEAALLAGLVNAPSYYDPLIHPAASLARRNLVLSAMARLGYISPRTAAAAQNSPLSLAPSNPLADRAPYFTKYVVDQISRLDPAIASRLMTGGYRITTSLNGAVQRAAEDAVAWDAPAGSPVNGVTEPQVALVAVNPQNGYVEALVGGRNFATTQLDRATKAARPPGSAMKYFLYTAVINNGYPTSSVQKSAPVRFPAGNGRWYVPHNYGDVYHGPLTIRRAIAYSDNIVATKWMNIVGPPTMIRIAQSMGITSPLADNLTTALGSSSVTPLEMATAVSPLANGGYRVRPLAVLSITDQSGREVYHDAPRRMRVLTPQVAYVVTNLFESPLNNPQGTANDLKSIFSRPAAAKTGTSSGQRDAWLVGYTPQLASAVWVGNDNNAPLGMTGDAAAGPIWANFMHMALANTPAQDFRQPSGLVWRRVCLRTGLLPNGCCTTYREVFIRGHTPTRVSPGCGDSSGSNAGPSASSLLDSLLKSLTP